MRKLSPLVSKLSKTEEKAFAQWGTRPVERRRVEELWDPGRVRNQEDVKLGPVHPVLLSLVASNYRSVSGPVKLGLAMSRVVCWCQRN